MGKHQKKLIILLLFTVVINAIPAYASNSPTEQNIFESLSAEDSLESSMEEEPPATSVDKQELLTEETDPQEDTTEANLDDTGTAENAETEVFSISTEAATTAQIQSTESKGEDEVENAIIILETESVMDAEGNVTISVGVAENVTLPLTITMKGSNGLISFSITKNNQPVKIKPDSYRITKAIDGNKKKLSAGAYLTVPEDGGNVYLDFTKPESANDKMLKSFLNANIFFIPVALAMYAFYRWSIKNMN